MTRQNAELIHGLPHSPGRRRRSILKCILAALLSVACAWSGWREYDRRAAIAEAQAAGFTWESREPFDLIRKDWRAAFRMATWTESFRRLEVGEVRELASLRPLFLRLRPTILVARMCKDSNLNGLKDLTALEWLDLDTCPCLQNVDVLKTLTGLKGIAMYRCFALQNVDPLKGLSDLQALDLSCSALQNVDALKGLTGLQRLNLTYCRALQNVDGLKGLSGLQTLNLQGCTAIPAQALRELRLELRKTTIYGP